MLVGKNASLDGSTMIARNEDGNVPLVPQKFIVVNPDDQPRHYQSVLSTFNVELPDNPLRYTATPNADPSEGVWGASGINSQNVAMSATETITTNSRILGIDPLCDDGIGEEDMLTIVLPYINSAREGVLRLGAILTQYGTYETNGICFSDKDECWYFESIAGHHWMAVRIPDDAYVVAPNRMNIDDFDFTDTDNYLASADLEDLIAKFHLNPDADGYNMRHIFGSATIKDTRYNNSRAWYGQKYFNPEFDTEPIDQDLPFICRTDKKISVEDVKFVLSSHYQNTPYDPYGTGTTAEKKQFRPIGINRNQELHILQIRNDVPAEIAGIHWLAYGPNTFNAVVPFYANVTNTPALYRDTTPEFDQRQMYWLSCTLAVLGDTNFGLFEDFENIFEQNTVAACRHLQIATDESSVNADNLDAHLQAVNAQMAQISYDNSSKLLGQMVALAAPQMKLQFTLND